MVVGTFHLITLVRALTQEMGNLGTVPSSGGIQIYIFQENILTSWLKLRLGEGHSLLV